MHYVATYKYGRAFAVHQTSAESAAGVMSKLQQPSAQPDRPSWVTKLFLRKGLWVGGFANLKESFVPQQAAEALASCMP